MIKWLLSIFLFFVIGHSAVQADEKAPAPQKKPPTVDISPEDREVIEHMDVLEAMELVDNLDLLEDLPLIMEEEDDEEQAD